MCRWPGRDKAATPALCLFTVLLKAQAKCSVTIQKERKWDNKDAINLYNESPKSCPLPGGVCMWILERKGTCCDGCNRGRPLLYLHACAVIMNQPDQQDLKYFVLSRSGNIEF